MFNKTAFKPLISGAILHSIKWQFADKISKLFGSVVVGMLVGRYLGPEQFGLLNFVYAFVWMFATVGTIGLDEVVVKELIEKPEDTEKILGTSIVLKIIGATLSVVITFGSAFLLKNHFEFKIWLILFTIISMIIRNLGIARLWYESKIQSKKVMIIDNLAFLIGVFLKLLFVFTNKPVEYFAFTVLVEFAISTAILHHIFTKGDKKISISNYDKKWANKLLNQSWPLIIIGFSIMLYTRSDQVMLTLLSSSTDTGIYSAAVRISEVFYFIPTAITISFFPAIVKHFNAGNKENYHRKVQALFDLLLIISIILTLFMTLLAYPVILLGFGADFIDSVNVLNIHIWGSIFVFLGVASSKIMVVEHHNKYNMYRTLIGAILNILLNLLLIPKLGSIGAAISTVFSYMVSVYACILFKPTRHIAFFMLKSLNPLGLFIRGKELIKNMNA